RGTAARRTPASRSRSQWRPGTTASRPTRSRCTPGAVVPASKSSSAEISSRACQLPSSFATFVGFGFFCLILTQATLAVASDCEDLVTLVRTGEHDSHRVTSLRRHLGNGRAYHLALGENDENFVFLFDNEAAGEFAA